MIQMRLGYYLIGKFEIDFDLCAPNLLAFVFSFGFNFDSSRVKWNWNIVQRWQLDGFLDRVSALLQGTDVQLREQLTDVVVCAGSHFGQPGDDVQTRNRNPEK